jgi:hypothetical protein
MSQCQFWVHCPADKQDALCSAQTTRATIHVNVQKPDLARHTQLSDKMDDLLTDCIAKNIYPELSARIATFAAVHPKAVAVMLSKGRRLIEQTLDSCQMKRSKCAEVEVELKHVARHLGKWRILGLDILFPDLAAISLHAKHRCAALLSACLIQSARWLPIFSHTPCDGGHVCHFYD